MLRFLVVDDSPLERRMVSVLLGRLEDAEVVTADDGLAALEAVRRARPDVVISDLQMPRMDGLDLLDALQEECPEVPVVIVTSKGCEEMAVAALQQGAAGYIPKRLIGRDLVGVVERLVEASRDEAQQAQWKACVRRRELRLSLPNDVDLMGETVRQLQRELEEAGFDDERQVVRTGVAIHEALVNAIVHGNLGVGSDLRDRNDGAYEALIARRRERVPYRDRSVEVALSIDDEAATIVIADEGDGFDVAGLPDATDPENLLKCSGRGILMMRSFVDDVRYNDRGNEVTLRKRRPDHVASTFESILALARRPREFVRVS